LPQRRCHGCKFAAETASKGPGRLFEKGRSGTPVGRPRSARNKATLAADALFDSEAEALSRKAVELALGSEAALRLCLDRIIAPRRERPIQLAVPSIQSASDIAAAMGTIVKAAAQGHRHARRGVQAEPHGRHLRPGDRYQRLRQVAANVGKRACRGVLKRGRLVSPLSEIGSDYAGMPIVSVAEARRFLASDGRLADLVVPDRRSGDAGLTEMLIPACRCPRPPECCYEVHCPSTHIQPSGPCSQ